MQEQTTRDQILQVAQDVFTTKGFASASVSGGWSEAGSDSCTTDSIGQCSVSLSGILKRIDGVLNYVGAGASAPPSVSITSPADGDTVSGAVTVTADATDDSGVAQVDFFVDGSAIRTDTDGSDGWSAAWDTTAYDDGSHQVTATVTDTAGQTASDSIGVTVDNAPSSGLTVTAIEPNTMTAGTTIDVTISGSGFASGADVAFENGSGPAPEASNVIVSGATTITAEVTAKSGGPPQNRVWDVRVTNADGSSAVLAGGFTVSP